MLRRYCDRVAVVERRDRLLRKASYHNQARVHQGYHYPRSVLTGLRSRVNFPRFVHDFRECVVDSFTKLYAVAAVHSKVTAGQFETFCRRIGAPMWPAPPELAALFDPDLIEAVWQVEEFAFDAEVLARIVAEELEAAGVTVLTGATVTAVEARDDLFRVAVERGDGDSRLTSRWLFNATYANLNFVLDRAGRPPIPLKHELAELCLVEVPEPLANVGVTVMCGPFFSLMPFPPRGLHSFSHVRYTPHGAWQERALPGKGGGGPRFDRPADVEDFALHTAFEAMRRDAARYLPLLRDLRYRDSLWEIKTVLPQSEDDDSRPILFARDPQLPRLVSVMGGKIDNIYDLPREVAALLGEARAALPARGRVDGV